MTEEPRRLSRHETHDLGMIIKDRAKVLKAYTDEQEARCLADFEHKLGTIFKFDQDDVWKAAVEAAQRVVIESREKIAKRCEELGIPRSFAPSLDISWTGRGENALERRRMELRNMARTEINAMKRAAVTKIEKQSLDLRTQVVAMGLLSADAKLFLESLAPVEDTMHMLDFGEIEKKLEADNRRFLTHRYRPPGGA